MTTDARELAVGAVRAGIAAADPERAVAQTVTVDDDRLRAGDHTIDLAAHDRVVVAGGGKAAASVTRGLHALLGDRIDDGLVVTTGPGGDVGPVECAAGDHPTPSRRNVEAAGRLAERLQDAGKRTTEGERTLVLAPVTGGASALLTLPGGSLSLADVGATNDALLASGATIHEINTVRKHLSALKGGRAALAAAPATVLVLLVSDVVGDDPGVIGSGPFTPDETTDEDALAVLDRYDLDVPAGVRAHLEAGGNGNEGGTPGEATEAAYDRVHTHLLVSNRGAIDAAVEYAEDAGVTPCVLSATMRGEARECGLAHVAVAEEIRATGRPVAPPALVLSGGECTVTVTGDGRGGPNQECAVRGALELPEGCAFVAVDTDGEDGGTDVAGGIVDSATVEAPAAAWAALAENDTYTYLAAREGHVTVESETNVNDLRALAVEPAGRERP